MPRISDHRLAAMAKMLPAHRKHSDVSFAKHYSRRVADLAEFVLPRRRVYLDTRYWIFLRDAAMGRPQRPIHTRLLTTLSRGVETGSLLCPLGDSTFFELLRQADARTRLASARLMDRLSLGVTIQNALDRLDTELLDFLVTTTKHQRVPGPPVGRVWLKCGHVLGTALPVLEGLDTPEQLAVSKAFFDLMWSVSLEELLTDTPIPDESGDAEFARLAAQITAASRAHSCEASTWNDVYIAEIQGFFDVHIGHLRRAFVTMHRSEQPDAGPPTQEDFRQTDRLLLNSFTNIFRFGKAGTSLPMAQIVAGLHAIIRWHRQRPFVAGDFYDIYHATAALPYCDFFLTERFLATALTRPPLDLAKRFGAVVVCDAETALQAIDAVS